MHERRENQSLEIHRRIAGLLIAEPERVIGKALSNLNSWITSRDASAPGSAYQEWLRLLQTHTAEEIAKRIVSTDEDAVRLRQSSPFAGILPPREIWSIKRTNAAA
jgi:hypothetical protein